MQEDNLNKEQRILRVMRKVLANIVKDVTPQPGMLSPLSQQTITDIRECFGLIAAREAELAQAAGHTANEKPYYTDQEQKSKVVPLSKIGIRKKDPEGNEH